MDHVKHHKMISITETEPESLRKDNKVKRLALIWWSVPFSVLTTINIYNGLSKFAILVCKSMWGGGGGGKD